jgi:hypothetical protein
MSRGRDIVEAFLSRLSQVEGDVASLREQGVILKDQLENTSAEIIEVRTEVKALQRAVKNASVPAKPSPVAAPYVVRRTCTCCHHQISFHLLCFLCVCFSH